MFIDWLNEKGKLKRETLKQQTENLQKKSVEEKIIIINLIINYVTKKKKKKSFWFFRKILPPAFNIPPFSIFSLFLSSL